MFSFLFLRCFVFLFVCCFLISKATISIYTFNFCSPFGVSLDLSKRIFTSIENPPISQIWGLFSSCFLQLYLPTCNFYVWKFTSKIGKLFQRGHFCPFWKFFEERTHDCKCAQVLSKYFAAQRDSRGFPHTHPGADEKIQRCDKKLNWAVFQRFL